MRKTLKRYLLSKKKTLWPLLSMLTIAGLVLSACQPRTASASLPTPAGETASVEQTGETEDALTPTPFPTRPPYPPGELVDYTAQTGDNLPALAVRFNTTVSEILEANPFIPQDATTMPPGMPMQIPIYFKPFWGTPYQILPDSLFINGPAQSGFNTQEFVNQHPGWLNGYVGYVSGETRTGAQVVDLAARHYSISPRLLLALLEYQSGALSQPILPPEKTTYPLGYASRSHPGVYMQLVWAANTLNNGYYDWRTGKLTTLDLLNGRIENPDPWQNAATVSLQYFFSKLYADESFSTAISPEGFAQTYASLFGDPWDSEEPHIPGSLVQPDFRLPFQARRTWAYTGGPHTGWGEGAPWAALDFAPPSVIGGCTPTQEWATAVAPGVVVRSEPGTVVLDLDGDGDERTGWTVFYFHLAAEDRAALGTVLQAGDPLGHPSCEGGRATGTHVHIARKYNGEWIPAGGVLAFNLDGWIAREGAQPYQGTLTRHSRTISACECSDQTSHISFDQDR